MPYHITDLDFLSLLQLHCHY